MVALLLDRLLPRPLLLLVLLTPLAGHADHVSPYQAQHLLQWDQRQQFFEHWLDTKKQGSPLIRALLESHSEVDNGHRSSKVVPSGFLTLNQLNRLWLRQAVRSYQQQDWQDSLHALDQLGPPLSSELVLNSSLLQQALAIQLDQPLKPLPVLEQQPLQPLLDYNQALTLADSNQCPQALTLLQKAPFSGPSELAERALLLKARCLALSGQPQRSLELLQTTTSQPSLQHRDIQETTAPSQGDDIQPALQQLLHNHLQVTALAHLQAGDIDRALKPLLVLAEHGDQQLTDSNIRLLKLLRQQGADTQANLLAGKWLLPLQQDFIRIVGQIGTVKSQSFVERLSQRQSSDPVTEMIGLLSKEARLLLTEIERINSLSRQLQQQLAMAPQLRSLFEQDPRKLKSQIGQHADVSPGLGQRLPASVLNGDPQIRALEQRLTELVGQPTPWKHRYTLLDGLSVWHTEKPFQHRWWPEPDPVIPDKMITPKVDSKAAATEMAKFAAEQLSKIALLEDIRIEQELPKLPLQQRRAKAMLNQLKQQKSKLGEALAASLKLEPEKMIEQIEHDLLWLTIQLTPQEHQFDQVEQQRWFDIASGQFQPLPSTTQPPYELALSALQALVDNAINPPVQLQAMRYLADLKLLLSERIINGDPIPPRPDITPAKAIELYQQLIASDNRSVIDRSQVLYQLAKAYEFEGQQQATLNTLEQLLREQPEHPLLAELSFRIAELQFSLRNYDLASDAYQQLLTLDNAGEFEDKARYKLAWSLFKRGLYPQALDHFFVLADQYWPLQSQQQPDASQQALLDDTLRVIALTFAYIADPQAMDQRFAQGKPKPYEKLLYRNLAAYYDYKRRYSDAADAYNTLARRFPDDEEAPFYQSRVVNAYIEGGFPSKAWPARELFVERFGINSASWQQADEPQRQRILQYLPGYLSELAKRDHALAQKQRKQAPQPATTPTQEPQQPTAAQLALAWYEQFVTAVPEDPQVAEMLFLKAELLTDLDQLDQAALTYKQVAYQYPNYPRRDEAGYAALLAYQKLHSQAPAGSFQADRWLQKGIEEGLVFASTFPDSKYTAKTQVKVAEDLLIQDDYPAAIKTADDLLQRFPELDTGLQVRLWRIMAQGYFDSAQFLLAEQAYLKFITLPLAEEELQTSRKRLAETIYKQGEHAQQAGDQLAALSHFQRLEQIAPKAHILPQAKFDALVLLMQLERWPEAVAALEQFRRQFGSHPLQETLDDKLVVAYENTQQWSKAAAALNRIYQREGDSELGREALWRSAALFEKSAQPKQARSGYQGFVERFPKPHEPAMEARLKAYQLSQQLNDEPAQQRWLNALVTVEKQAGSASTDRTLTIASNASLTLGKQAMSDFLLQSLTLPLKKSLPRKQQAMERSIGHLVQVSNFGLARPSTEATVLIGQIYKEFAQALMSSQRPKELNELELEQYEILLEEQALPFEDKAISLHEINVGRIAQGVYTPAIETSLEELRELMPARYAKPEQLPEYSDEID